MYLSKKKPLVPPKRFLKWLINGTSLQFEGRNPLDTALSIKRAKACYTFQRTLHTLSSARPKRKLDLLNPNINPILSPSIMSPTIVPIKSTPSSPTSLNKLIVG